MKYLSIRTRFTLTRSLIIGVVLAIIGFSFSHYDQRLLTQNQRVTVADAMTRAQVFFNEAYRPGNGELVLPPTGNTVVQIVSFDGHQLMLTSSGFTNLPILANEQSSVTASSGLRPHFITNPHTRFIRSQLHGGQALALVAPHCVGPVCKVYENGWFLGPAVGQSLGATQRTLTLAFLVLWLVLSLLIWLSVGAALAPVEVLRRRLSAITAGDTSERVEVMSRNDEFSRLAESVNAMLDRLEEGTKSKQQFVSNASHELRSPLATLLATVDLAVASSTPPQWSVVAETVQREGRRLNSLIDDLFWLARSAEKQIPKVKQEVDIDDLLLEEADRVRGMTTLRVDTSAVTPARVWGDPALLARALRNIVDNAVRYATSALAFSCFFEGGTCVIRIHDDGVGVDLDEAEKYFERFVREDSARTRASGGTGLGLAIVADIMARHGGGAHFIPTPTGSTIELRLRRY